MALRISGDGSLNYLDATFNNVTASGLSASGNVVLPSTTEIGAVSSTELGYVDGVTSALQTQLNTLDSGLASKLPYSYGTATPSTSDNGFLWYDSNSTPAEVKFWDGAAFQAIGGGKILQIVRATDSTSRSTTSTSYVDANLSVTITPQKSDSAIILIGSYFVDAGSTTSRSQVAITDSSNNLLSGAERGNITDQAGLITLTQIGYSTPATTSATTYKVRFLAQATGTTTLLNALNTAQLYAIEVSA